MKMINMITLTMTNLMVLMKPMKIKLIEIAGSDS
jgi:hypothetical protein